MSTTTVPPPTAAVRVRTRLVPPWVDAPRNPHSGTAEPAKLAAAVVDTMKQEYQGLEAEPIEESIAGHELVGYDLAFYCLDLTNTAHVRSLRFAHTTYTIYSQAEDREYEQVKRVFEAMTLTLLGSLKDLHYLE